MYFYIFILCLNTMTSMINTNAFFSILLSGTLAPISSFMTELGNDFAARTAKSGIMEGMHVIDTKRQLVRVRSVLSVLHALRVWCVHSLFNLFLCFPVLFFCPFMKINLAGRDLTLNPNIAATTMNIALWMVSVRGSIGKRAFWRAH